MPLDPNFKTMNNGSAVTWEWGNAEFLAVKLEGYSKSHLDATGGVKITGITGQASKDNEIASEWLVFVKQEEKVMSLENWNLKEQADHLARITGAPVDAIFKNSHIDKSEKPSEGSL